MWQAVWDWFEANPAVWTTLVGVSIATFVCTLIAVPMVVVRIPADYFVRAGREPSAWAKRHPVSRLLLVIAKNVLGVLLILAGIAMLVLPGQGLVTILIGLMLTSFPGKFALERWLIRRRQIRRAVNWMRRRSGRAELDLDGVVTGVLPASDQPGPA